VVPAAGCQGAGCANRNAFGTADSATFQQTSNPSWTIDFGTASASGVVVQDTMNIAGYTIPNMLFGAANNMDQGVTDNVWPAKGLVDLVI
jgi:cathepsin D